MKYPPYIKYEIRQFGKSIIIDNQPVRNRFFNLTGRNFDTNVEYQKFLNSYLPSSGFTHGEIELFVNDKLIIKGEISKELIKNN